MNLLIVEDNTQMRYMLRDLLNDLPVSIMLADCAASAVVQAGKHHPELVLMDILLPERDGIELTKQFLSEGWTSHVYMVTECRESRFRQAAGQAGAEQYFLKDNLLDVRRAVMEFLQNDDAHIARGDLR